MNGGSIDGLVQVAADGTLFWKVLVLMLVVLALKLATR